MKDVIIQTFQFLARVKKSFGVYDNGENRFEMTGIVKDVFYNTDMNLIIVECKCVDIRKK